MTFFFPSKKKKGMIRNPSLHNTMGCQREKERERERKKEEGKKRQKKRIYSFCIIENSQWSSIQRMRDEQGEELYRFDSLNPACGKRTRRVWIPTSAAASSGPALRRPLATWAEDQSVRRPPSMLGSGRGCPPFRGTSLSRSPGSAGGCRAAGDSWWMTKALPMSLSSSSRSRP